MIFEILNFSIGILGLVASFVGFYFTYISFVNPLIRFKKYLSEPKDWEKFIGIETNLDIYRHKKNPSFEILINWDNELVENFHEEWMNDVLFADKTNNCSYFVQMRANGVLLQKELFVSLDGHRNFVPVPRNHGEVEGTRFYYYDLIQIQLSKIVGKFHLSKDIFEFAESQKNLVLNKSL